MRRMSDATDVPAVPPMPENSRASRSRWSHPLVVGIACLAVGAGVVGLVWGLSSGGSGTPKPFTLRGTVTLTSGSTLVGTPEQKLCTGNPASGMDDVAQGAAVTVYDASGSVVASGSLGAGRYPSDAFLTNPCRFAFAVPGVPGDSKFYQVEISHRGKVSVSAAEAKAGGFAASLG